MPTDHLNALVLPDSAASGSSEARMFPGMPGRYRPGEPVLLTTVELTQAEARELIDALGVPLEFVSAKKENPAVPDELVAEGNRPFESNAADLTPQPPKSAASVQPRSTVGGSPAAPGKGDE